MSFQAGLNCVDTDIAASTFYGLQQSGLVVSINGSSYISSLITPYANYHVIKYTSLAGAAPIWTSAPFVAQPCRYHANPFILSVTDASALSLAILTVWVAAWAIRQVISYFRSEPEAVSD